ncbi:MAG TPA: DsbA family protein [Anaerolineae bacterium]|nr:DsbA family protein [Anaerolineae bacterium]
MTKRRSVQRRQALENESSRTPMLIIGGIIAGIVILGLAAYLILGQGSTAQGSEPLDVTGLPFKGEADAPVTMIEFSDYGCSHCRNYVLEKSEQLIDGFVETGQVKYVVYPYYLGNPLIGRATEAALCANDQGKFFEYQRTLFQKQGQIQYSPEELTQVASEVGLDTEALNQCLSNGTYRDRVEQGRLTAVQRGVNSTPTFFVNNQRIEGNVPYDQFVTVINQELQLAQN